MRLCSSECHGILLIQPVNKVPPVSSIKACSGKTNTFATATTARQPDTVVDVKKQYAVLYSNLVESHGKVKKLEAAANNVS